MKHVLITGSEGQLGKTFRKISLENDSDFDYHFTDLAELDITDYYQVLRYCRDNSIEILINCAAYTAVDNAEDDKEKAYHINSQGVLNLSTVCSELNIFLIHISTDYVFDGEQLEPYDEGIFPNPVSVYGASKYSGEQEMIGSGVKGVILRTSWLYSEYGNNFVFTILKLTKERSHIQVVHDQIGTPTYSKDLAEVIIRIMEKKDIIDRCELFHYSNEGSCSWCQFAKKIIELKGIDCRIEGIPSSSYFTKAKRPKHSVLNKQKVIEFLKFENPSWENSLEKMLKKID